MAVAKYRKNLPAGVGQIIVWDETNFDEIVTMAGAANVRRHIGNLYVFDELIEPGDGVAMTDDGTPLHHAKYSKQWLLDNQFEIDVIVYDSTPGNINEIIAHVGIGQIKFQGTKLYVGDVFVEDGDAVAKSGGSMIPVVDVALLASDYTVVS